jgi:hypothetical protein
MVPLNAKDNGAVGDKSFAVKRPKRQKSHSIGLTLDVIERTKAHADKWTVEDIRKRQKMPADLALKRWPLNPS